MKKITFTLLLTITLCASLCPADDIASKVDALLKEMTLEEKAGQLTLYASKWEHTGPVEGQSYVKEVRAGQCGSILNAPKVEYARQLQELAVNESRLGIPLMFGFDVIHGFKTIFPIPLGLASSWDMDAIEKSARVAATEAAASSVTWTYAPMVDIARDPRWGRIAEGAGEDTFLACEVARANVRGFQGKDLADNLTVAACVKHFAAYGAAQAGRDYHTVDMSERMLRETYLPPFKAALDEGAATLMTAFNELDGVPATGSEFLLKKILRDEWGFKGMVVTDYTSINEMIPHGAAKDLADAAALAMNAGVDLDMMGSAYLQNLEQLVKEERVTMKQIDNAVRNVLTLKFKLGLFDDPFKYCDEEREKKLVYAKEHMEAAYDISGKSIVLLKNKDQLLPLKTGKRIAVIGEMAETQRDLLGTWRGRGDWEVTTNVLHFITSSNGEKRTTFTPGCSVYSDDTSGFKKAISAAKKSDVVIMVLGETSRMSGEAASRSNINLPGSQTALLREIKKTKKPIVLLLLNGRPLALEEEDELADAILEAWHPGSLGSKVIADMIFGKLVPSGKLPVTFPRNLGQVPIHYNLKNTGRPYDPNYEDRKFVSKYIDTSNDPLYPFGYGLSYTSFNYSDLKLSKQEMKKGETLKASAKITNTGDYDGEEVVQLYIRDLVGSVTRPLKELKGFQKIFLKKGESKTVEFTVGEKELKFLRRDMTWGSEPGDFEVFIGTNSRDAEKVSFTLL